MKIITPGAVNDWWVGRKQACRACHTVVEFEKGDKVRESLGEAGAAIFFTCPMCGNQSVMLYVLKHPD